MASASLPPSPPRGWPDHASESDLAAQPRRRVCINPPDAQQEFSFRSNFVKSSKYTLLTFPFIFLWESFHPLIKGANFYFLIIAALQMVPEITNTNGAPTMLMPIGFVVAVDGIMAVLEDLEKHEADRRANSSETQRLQPDGTWSEQVLWMDVKVGDIIRVKNREVAPADLLLLATSEPDMGAPQGVCYVETKSLDGETNLKMRIACRSTLRCVDPEDLCRVRGVVELNHPDANMHSIEAIIDVQGAQDDDALDAPPVVQGRRPISMDNVLLRGVTVRNTEWIAGIVLNTGDDTKIVMSSTEKTYKQSRLDGMVNSQLLAMVVLLSTICLAGAIGSVVYDEVLARDHWYLYPVGGSSSTGRSSHDGRNPGVLFVIMFFYFFLLFANLIPISLYVSMAIIKSGQAYFMTQDLKVYHAPTDTPMQVKNMRLNEELGQVSHIFSDKTGTLTCNVMDFRKFSVHGVQYGLGTTSIGEASAAVSGRRISQRQMIANDKARRQNVPHVAFYDDELWAHLDGDTPMVLQPERLRFFFRVLALCHSVIPERDASGTLKYSASSPDDEALVCGARYFGFAFVDRVDGLAVLEVGAPQYTPPSATRPPAETVREEYEMLELLEFTSLRKRMSVIVRDQATGKIHLMSKGADSAMRARLDMETTMKDVLAATELQLERLAEEGLRTLMVAGKVVPEEEFNAWSEAYESATSDLTQIQLRKRGEPNEIDRLMDVMESGMELYGATAIEDRLQEHVPETIAKLMEAGIKVWMLTGDKEETAINIGRACQLIKRGMNQIIVNDQRLRAAQSATAAQRRGSADSVEQEFVCRVLDEQALDVARSKGIPLPDLDEDQAAAALRAATLRTAAAAKSESPPSTPRSGWTAWGAEDEDDEEAAALTDGEQQFALVVDGVSLMRVMQDEVAKKSLLRLALLCDAVIACRTSPKQKMEIVKMVCQADSTVLSLAIGDGANDVAMIKSAHIGIGISGQEGMQAVNNSDFAIAQFSFLERLLLVQGRYNYRRSAKAVLYIFYKNVVFTVCNFWLSFVNLMSGQKYIIEAGVLLYNVVFTFLPIVMLGIFDRDVKETSAVAHPALYTPCIHNLHFNERTFWRWVFEAVVQSAIISYLPTALIEGWGEEGAAGTMTVWEYGGVVITLVILTVNLKICIHQNMWTWWQAALLVLTVASWWCVGFAYEAFTRMQNGIIYYTGDGLVFWGVFTRLQEMPSYWFVILLTLTVVWMRDFGWKAYMRMFRPTVYMIAQELDHGWGDALLASPALRRRRSSTAKGQWHWPGMRYVLGTAKSPRRRPGEAADRSPSPGPQRAESKESPRRRPSWVGFEMINFFGGAAHAPPPEAIARFESMRGSTSGFAADYDDDTMAAERSLILNLPGRARRLLTTAIDPVVSGVRRLSAAISNTSMEIIQFRTSSGEEDPTEEKGEQARRGREREPRRQGGAGARAPPDTVGRIFDDLLDNLAESSEGTTSDRDVVRGGDTKRM